MAKEKGWVCPVCGAGVAPSVKEHCKDKAPAAPVWPHGPQLIWCNLCHYYYSTPYHVCGGSYQTPNTPWNPNQVWC